jgi:uncharacterized protein
MKRRVEFDPRRLDVDAFVDQGGTLQGVEPLATLERLASLVLAEAPEAAVRWAARGVVRPGPDRQPQRWIHVDLHAGVRMTCQRCLEPVALDLDLMHALRFVATEDEAQRLDLESEDDVLASSRQLDLLELVEDELVLALPAVPRHDRCTPPAHAAEPPGEPTTAENPFAVLRRLGTGPGGDTGRSGGG